MEFGEAGFPKYGTGSFIQSLPKTDTLEFGDFSGGYFSATNRENVPPNTTPYAIDIEVTNDNRLKRSPGTTILEVFATRTPDHFLTHGSLDFTAELVFFDPPFLGVKRLGVTDWANKAFLETGWFAWANFGGTLIFTDGAKVYARQVNDGTTIVELTEAPVALAYASWAARMWAFAAVIGPQFEPLGIVWSAADSDYTDWTGLGAGSQLLINQISAGDRGVALVPMGLDFMAIFLRKSIWIARRTGLLLDPGDFQPRVPNKGAVNNEVLQATEKGVIYLSDGGVEIFDGNESKHISFQIDPELLPLDYEKILEYSSSYDPTANRYYLHTPRGNTWIYELNFDRWVQRSLHARASVIWPLQAESAVVEGEDQVVFLGDSMAESVALRAIEVEDQASEVYFGEPQTPIWSLRPMPQKMMNMLLTSKQFNIEYEGAAGIELWAPNNFGVYEALIIDSLISQSPPDVVEIYAAKTGRLASLQLRITTGNAEFIHLQVHFVERGPRVAIGVGGIPGNFPARTSLQVFPQGSIAAWTGGPGGPAHPAASAATSERLSRYRYQFTLDGVGAISPPITAWLWDFGDGETSTEESPTHTYATAGTYTVTVQPVSDWFYWSVWTQTLAIAEEPLGPTVSFIAAAEGETGILEAWHETPGGEVASQTSWDLARAQSSSIIYPFSVDFQIVAGAPRIPDFGWNESDLSRVLMMFPTTAGFSFDPIAGRIKVKVSKHATYLNGASPGTLNSQVLLAVWPKVAPNTLIVDEDPSTDTTLAAGQAIILASDTLYTLSTLTVGQVLEFELNVAGLAFVKNTGYTNFALMNINDYTGDIPTGWLTPVDPSSANILQIGFYMFEGPDPMEMFPTLEIEGAAL